MVQPRLLPPGALLLAAALTAACAGGAAGGAASSEGLPPSGALSTAELEALYRSRVDSARMRFTEADVRFMSGMISHHAQALLMARLAPTNDASPRIRTLAGRILGAQQDEIAIMQQWLRDRGQTVPEVHVVGSHVMVHGSEHSTHMPGMLTADQMRELEHARGAAFDRLFLAFMIQHHRGAVSMVEDLFTTDGAGQDEEVFRFASDVQVDQITEITRMELMLSELTAGGRSP